MSRPFSVGNVTPAGQRRFRFGASTALVAFTLLEWPVAILIQRAASADGRLWFEAVTGFLFFSPVIFAPLSALCSIAYFVKLRRAQYIMELALSLAFFALFVALVEPP
jgi:hypothetical protein